MRHVGPIVMYCTSFFGIIKHILPPVGHRELMKDLGSYTNDFGCKVLDVTA